MNGVHRFLDHQAPGLLILAASIPLVAADVDSVLKLAVGPKGVPAVVAMVASGDQIVYKGAAGSASLDSVFRIFSMTKPVTAVAAMQLVEQGKLDLDARAERYLPELAKVKVLDGYDAAHKPILRSPASGPTVRQLMSHTAGYGYPIWDEKLANYPDAWDGLKAPLVFDPGEKWQYGVSYEVLGRIIERVSGENLEDYFQQHIFKPLGMSDTTFHPPATVESRIVKHAVRKSDGSYKEERVPLPAKSTPSGGGGLFSTAADYVRFMQMFLRGGDGVLKPESIALMRQNQIGALNVRRMISTDRSITLDFGFHIEAGDKFGFGFQVNPAAYENGRAAKSWRGRALEHLLLDRP